jgi:hypothetical protein
VGFINTIRSVMAEYGSSKPLWITEAGVALASRRNGRILSQKDVNAQQEARGLLPTQPWRLWNLEWRSVSEQRGAALVIRANVQSLTHGVQQLYWFRQHAREHSWFWDDLSIPTLQVRAHRVFAGFLSGGLRFARKDEPLHEGRGTDLYVYWFRRPSDWVAILWRQQRTNVRWPMLWAAYLGADSTSIDLPIHAETAYAHSMFGEAIPVSVSGRRVTLMVGEDPVYLVLGKGTGSR